MKNKEIWPFMFMTGLLFFNWPLMNLFETVLPYYLYTTWFFFILLIGILASLRSRMDKGRHVQ